MVFAKVIGGHFNNNKLKFFFVSLFRGTNMIEVTLWENERFKDTMTAKQAAFLNMKWDTSQIPSNLDEFTLHSWKQKYWLCAKLSKVKFSKANKQLL